MSSLAQMVVDWSPLCHAPAAFLDQFDLPSDGEALADWLFGVPDDLEGVRYASPELIVAAAPVMPVASDLFSIDDAGKWSVIQPVSPDGNGLVDLVSWHPCQPDRWRRLTGDGEALGEREIALRQDGDGPLKVFATPLSWHRAGGRGVCLLRREWQVAQRLFIGETELIAETVELGTSLDRALRFRPAPKILMQSLERAA